MVFVEICVGSSCHLKGAPELVKLFEDKIAEEHLENDVILSGSFCKGKCNRVGVTITVNEDVYSGITPGGFNEFWREHIAPALKSA